MYYQLVFLLFLFLTLLFTPPKTTRTTLRTYIHELIQSYIHVCRLMEVICGLCVVVSGGDKWTRNAFTYTDATHIHIHTHAHTNAGLAPVLMRFSQREHTHASTNIHAHFPSQKHEFENAYEYRFGGVCV